MKNKLIVSILILIFFLPLMSRDFFKLIENKDLESIRRMVSENSEVLNEKDKWGFALIEVAARYNKMEIVEYLIKKGADANSIDPSGTTPLFYSANYGNIEMAKTLLASGADLYYKKYRKEPVIFRAVARGFVDYIEFCLNNGFNINYRDGIGNSLLAKSAAFAKPEVMKYLIKKKIDVNLVNNDGQSALHLAAIRGLTNIIQILIDAGAKVNLKDNDGHTPLFYAGKYGQKSAYGLLVQKSGGKEKVRTNFEFSKILTRDLKEGDAYIWYLTHSGWAVKTRKNLLVFDYIPSSTGAKHISKNPLLSNGHINVDELKNLNVTFFISHGHGDHFNKKILDFEKDNKKTSYVFGWQAFDNKRYAYMTKNKEQINVNGIEIESLLTTDPGAGFLVKVDGLSIFFFGDFNVAGDLKKTTKYISNKYKRIDLSFVLGLGGSLDISDYYIENVDSSAIFPIHGGNYEYLLKDYADKMSAKTKAVFCCPENRGDLFFYSKGKIIKDWRIN